jgi:D-alanyl-lipoteichoic acid acyltransferase DltB (MBOAT superfamily)
MVFNSIEFVVFFIAVFSFYYFVLKEKTKRQNILLLVASYVFYAYANWKILPLLMLSTAVFYGLGIAIFQTNSEKRKNWLAISGIIFGLGTLFYFKYANFFISSFVDLFESIGLQTNWHTFKIIVPVGISFYTFRLLSYVFDINRGKYEPERDIVAFSTYVAFFPCILSGPIDRPNMLIPQLHKKRVFDYALAVDGCRQILWGLFTKMVVADNCARVVNAIWDSRTDCNGSILLLGAALFSFQLYADFSGYSNMAIGTGKLLGFRLTKNFNYPFFAQNIADYWRRWHISLTSWLTDYIFMPLNVKWRNIGNTGMILAIIITFVLCGLWHGANWTFVIFGFYQGLLYIPLIISGLMFKKTKIEVGRWELPKWNVLWKILLTFCLVTLGNLVFRAESIQQFWDYTVQIFSSEIVSSELFAQISLIGGKALLLKIAIFLFLFLLMEWQNRNKEFGLQIDEIRLFRSRSMRWLLYIALIFCTLAYHGNQTEFVYIQF